MVRLQGSLRVIVNTKLWPDMLLERVSAKRLRMSGTVEDSVLTNHESEAPAISIYLISVSCDHHWGRARIFQYSLLVLISGESSGRR